MTCSLCCLKEVIAAYGVVHKWRESVDSSLLHLCKELNKRVEYIILGTDIHKLYIETAKLFYNSEGICQDLAWMIRTITSVDKWNSNIVAEQLDCLILYKTCHDDIYIPAYILNL